MKVPDGFTVSVGASEPEVKQPIAMALDDRGRVWIAEAYEYPIRAAGDIGRDRILIFEDTDGDGSLDSAKSLHRRTEPRQRTGSRLRWRLGRSGTVLDVHSRQGWRRCSRRRTRDSCWMDGGYQDTHETLNAFIWGPDGWLYGCHGVFTHSRVGKPGTPDEERVPLNCGVWRYHPTQT